MGFYSGSDFALAGWRGPDNTAERMSVGPHYLGLTLGYVGLYRFAPYIAQVGQSSPSSARVARKQRSGGLASVASPPRDNDPGDLVLWQVTRHSYWLLFVA